MPTYVGVIIGVVCALVFGFLGVLMGIQYRKKVAEAEIGSAEQEAKRIIEEGSKVAEQKKKEALISQRRDPEKQKRVGQRDQGPPERSFPTGAPVCVQRRIFGPEAGSA